ncbi:DEAD/DEAH box helicase [Nesterenkonia marinintestina]|uniref:DEAD/DEAH box helicase n=1 Tax=Nesterenkonia marinintestina TaxID=2979865 RepID=UPI0021BF2017|nr:DEAD/DEAH box helicase [Nesterenkonia sp. GX14115]
MSDAPVRPSCTREQILERVGAASALRGLRYAEAGHVGEIRQAGAPPAPGHPDGPLTGDHTVMTVDAQVAGTGPEPYTTTIFLLPTYITGGRVSWWEITEAICSCPVGFDCKHVAAVLFAAQPPDHSTAEGREDEPPRPAARGQARARTADWRSLLGPSSASAAGGEVSLALGVELARVERPFEFGPPRRRPARCADLDDPSAELSVTIRPLCPGARGEWIRGGLTWKRFQYGTPSIAFRRDHAELFGDICRTRLAQDVGGSFVADAMPLESFRGPAILQLMARCVRLGVRLVPQGALTHVELTDPSELTLDVRAAPRGSEADGLEVRARLSGVDVGTGPLRPLGAGFAALRGEPEDSPDAIALRIIPTDGTAPPELLALAAEPASLRIPPHEVEEFLHEAVPALRRRVEVASADGSVDFPEIPAPQLHLTVHHLGGDAMNLEWIWRYSGPSRLVPVRGAQQQDEHAAERLRAHEDEVVEAARAHFPEAATRPAQHLTGLETALFVERALPRLERQEHVVVEEFGDRPQYRELTEVPQLRVTRSPDEDGRSRDWFELGFQITVAGRVVPFKDVFEALSRGRARILLPDRTHLRLDHPHLLELKDLIDEAAAMGEWEPESPKISRYQVSFWDDLETLAQEVVEAETWRREASRLKQVLPESPEIPIPEPPTGLETDLRPYQEEGYAWLSFLYDLRLGGILADDMGLGKTVQALAMIARAREQEPTPPTGRDAPDGDAADRPPFLVVAPSSVVSVWRDEAARRTPRLDVRVLDATTAKTRTSVAERAEGADVVVTSYPILRLDADGFTGRQWAGLVLDEAQFVKNRTAKAHQVLKKVRAPFRLAVTGTPMENSLTDLWAILDLVTPGLMPPLRGFRDEYVRPIERPDDSDDGARRAAERMGRLRRRIRPFMLRRSKALVAAELPEKHEQVVRVPLRPGHRTLYEKVLQRERQKVLGLLEDMDRNRFIVFRSLTLLRMLALDPRIVDEAHTAPSSKLEALLPDLEEIVEEGHSVLIFSQFTSFLDRVAVRLDELGIGHARLDGSTRRRDEVVAGFRAGEVPVFLISLKAGGFGLTLTEADYVFLLDPWWNPAAEAQAVDRAHRIGQDARVMVYRMVAEGTIEERVLALQRRKAELFSSLTDGDAAFSASVTAEDIRELFASDRPVGEVPSQPPGE